MHLESRLGRLGFLPAHSWCIEKIEIPHRGTEAQRLRVQIAKLTLRVPDMGHPEALKWRCLRLGRLSTAVRHHREADTYRWLSGSNLSYSEAAWIDVVYSNPIIR